MDSSLVNMDLNKLKVPELRKELKARGLSSVGNKNELLERLQSVVKSIKTDDTTSAEADSVDDLEEDLLNEDDDEHTEENDSVLNDLDSTLDHNLTTDSVDTKQGVKRKSDEGVRENGSVSKRIVLNRTHSTANEEPVDSSTTSTNGSEMVSAIADDDIKDEKKTVKLSELSAKERLEMRAKKFGVPLSGDAKKEARAERFGKGTTAPTTTSATTVGSPKTKITSKSTPISASAPPSADVLKQRAERFGVKTSTTLTKLENQERLEKRKQRFGGNDINIDDITVNSVSAATKAQQRLERFKHPVK